MHIITVRYMYREMIMSKNLIALVLIASAATMVASCTVNTVSYTPGYTAVYSPGYTSVYADDYGGYPSYYWGYQNAYAPTYISRGYYGGWGGHRGWWGGFHGGHHR